jgi:HEAT repeat protein
MVDAKTALVNALVEVSPAHRQKVYAMLRAPGFEAVAALPYVLDELGSDDSSMRYQAAMMLAEIGPAAIEAKTKLLRLLADDDAVVRLAAALALYRIDPPDNE